VLAATHRDLNALVAESKFSRGSLVPLAVVPIEIPPLERTTRDIPLLVEYFNRSLGKRAGKKFTTIDKKSLKLFAGYNWPGNVRELQNVIERAVILCEGETFSVEESWLKKRHPQGFTRSEPLNGALVKQEMQIIEAALARSNGRILRDGGAAAKLGCHRARSTQNQAPENKQIQIQVPHRD